MAFDPTTAIDCREQSAASLLPVTNAEDSNRWVARVVLVLNGSRRMGVPADPNPDISFPLY